MRAWVVLLLALALAAPVAAAAGASLTLTAARTAVESGSVVPLAVRVELRGFWCQQAAAFAVEAMVRGSGAQASLPNGPLRFVTDDEPHFADAYVVEGNLSVAVEALGPAGGTVEVVATLAPPADCFAPDGFPAAAANVTLAVAPAPRPAEEPPANASAPIEANGTPAANESAADASGEDAGAPQESVRRMPPGAGYIGDYAPPENDREVPAAGLAALAGAAAVAALGRRKR